MSEVFHRFFLYHSVRCLRFLHRVSKTSPVRFKGCSLKEVERDVGRFYPWEHQGSVSLEQRNQHYEIKRPGPRSPTTRDFVRRENRDAKLSLEDVGWKTKMR